MTAAVLSLTSGRQRHRRVFVVLLAALAVLAWVALWAWARSPWQGYLRHDDWSTLAATAALCRAVPGGGVLVPAAIDAGAWVLMTAAMMLPATLPLAGLFERLVARRANRGTLMALLVAGYLAVWLAFGVAAHALQAALVWALGQWPALAARDWIAGAVIIGGAGAFQFSRLKYQCLDQCRAPLSFINQHWRGRSDRARSFLLGAHHGLFCVGCCWALMLLMFAIGLGSLGWMLVLAAVMAVEKNVSWGRRIGKPLGAALLMWAVVIASSHA